MKVSQWILACVALSMLASVAWAQGEVQYASPEMAEMAAPQDFPQGGPPMLQPQLAPMYAEGDGFGQYDGNCDPYGGCPDGNCPEGGGHGGHGGLFNHGDAIGSYWYGGAETLILRRSDADFRNLVFDTTFGDPVFTTDDLGFTYQPGVRTWVGYMFGGGWAVETLYSSVTNLNSDATVYGSNDLSLPGDFPLATLTFFNADRMRFDYTTKFYNAEVNVVRRWGDVEFLAGFRYVELNDDLNIDSFAFASGNSFFEQTATNQMYGGQIGTRAKVEVGYLGVDFYAKTAVLGNTMNQTNFAEDPTGFVLRNAEGADTSTTWLGELGISGVVQLGQLFSITGGYSVICLDRIALAPDQLDFTNTVTSGTGLRNDGSIILHGFNAGFVVHW